MKLTSFPSKSILREQSDCNVAFCHCNSLHPRAGATHRSPPLPRSQVPTTLTGWPNNAVRPISLSKAPRQLGGLGALYRVSLTGATSRCFGRQVLFADMASTSLTLVPSGSLISLSVRGTGVRYLVTTVTVALSDRCACVCTAAKLPAGSCS